MADDPLFERMLPILRRDEGWALTAYRDSLGILTIGCGHNLSVPITNAAVRQILRDDFDAVREQLERFRWFTNLDTVNHNNYAGIGHCDSCPSGFHFASPQIGVRAQIQHLKSYVLDDPKYVNPLVDRRLRGPAGCCQTWNELTGVWASAGGYTAYIMTIYADMLEWLYTQRTGLPPPSRPG